MIQSIGEFTSHIQMYIAPTICPCQPCVYLLCPLVAPGAGIPELPWVSPVADLEILEGAFSPVGFGKLI